MRELILAAGLLTMQPVERPPVEYQGLDPITVSVTFADLDWVNTECAKRLGRQPSPGNAFWACAGPGVMRRWAILPSGCLFADHYAGLVCHEVGHTRGWHHG